MIPEQGAPHAFALMMGLNVLFGVMLCFSGYFISKIRVVLGAILGCILAANIGFSVSPHIWVAMVSGIIGGVVGAIVSTVFYVVGLFLIGALLGGFLGGALSTAITHLEPHPAVLFVSAVAGGGVVLYFQKLRILIMMIATAMGGAGLIIFGVLCLAMTTAGGLFSWPDIFSNHGKFFGYAVLFGWILLSVSGFIVQYRLLPDPDKKRLDEKMDSAATSWDGDSSRV